MSSEESVPWDGMRGEAMPMVDPFRHAHYSLLTTHYRTRHKAGCCVCQAWACS